MAVDDSTPIRDDEDDATLAAIDEGARDAESGRVAPVDEVRGLLQRWIGGASSRKEFRKRPE